jgi:hypothetical protein
MAAAWGVEGWARAAGVGARAAQVEGAEGKGARARVVAGVAVRAVGEGAAWGAAGRAA